jgi:hypothetical protein
MSFPPQVAERALLDCARHCCICHKFCGFKIELHHIKQVADGGEDTYENCIPLCFDCHAEVSSYNPRHPKGRRYTESELRGHRDRWYEKVKKSHGITANPDYVKIDQQVFLKLREILPSTGSMSFVRDHHYAQPYEIDVHDDLRDFERYCKNPEFEFLDADLEGLKTNLIEYIDEFLSALGQHAFVDPRLAFAEREGTWCRIPKYFLNGLYNEKYLQEVTEVNKLADKVWEAYEALIRLGRRKLAI